MISDKQKALNKLMQLCSMKEYCEVEIRNKLKNYELNPEETDEIIKTLIKDNFINHKRYAKAFVNDKVVFNKWGKAKVRMALKQKQIAENIIHSSLEQLIQNDYQLMAEQELLKKMRSISNNTDPYITKQKLLRFGASRGYEIDLLYYLIDKILNKK